MSTPSEGRAGAFASSFAKSGIFALPALCGELCMADPSPAAEAVMKIMTFCPPFFEMKALFLCGLKDKNAFYTGYRIKEKTRIRSSAKDFLRILSLD